MGRALTVNGQRPLAPYLPRVAVEWCAEGTARTSKSFPGTLVFADVSGFTALSERLARRGRIGAEELTDVLGDCFARLLAVAYADGGSLLKFGGDALLLLFDGDGHAGRACRSALRMRRMLREMGRLETSVGAVRLRMSVGIHSGDVHLFLVGGSHRELIVTGPVATETVAMEAVAEAGEILVSPATAAAVEPRLLGAAKGPGMLLRDRVASAPDAAWYPPAPRPTVDVSHALPVALRSHLASAEVEPEHRHASIGFVKFEGVDEMLERSGEGTVAIALDQLVCGVQAAADEQQVTFLTTDIDRNGGKVILASGVPAVLGDDEGRILRALRRILAGEHPLRIRAGLNRGPLFAGEVGPPYRRTYTVMGDAVNLAARLMAAARPGQLLATAGVLERSRTAFEVEALAPLRVKGKSKPVQAFSVGPARGAARPRERGRQALPFVGRARELKVLREVLAEAWQGRGGLVEIVGEPGIGKSRLVEELCRLAQGATVVSVACEAYESATPYFAAGALIQQVLAVPPGPRPDDVARRLEDAVSARAPALRPWLPLLGVPLHVEVPATPETDSLEPRHRRERTNEAVADLLTALLPAQALLVVEDGQWMDEASADLLTSVTRLLPLRPWVVAVTRRSDPTGFQAPDTARALHLAPLRPADAAALVASATDDRPLRPHEADQLVARAEGNPLFLGELLRAGATPDSLPDTLEAVVSAQVDRLPPTARRLLRFAAVLGTSFSVAVLDAVTGSDGHMDLASSLDELTEYVEPDAEGSLRFRHRLVRDVAYEGLSFRRRRELHGRAAETIERLAAERASEHAEILSLHFLAAQRYDTAWRYAVAAGRRAQAKYANVDASELFDRALAAARHLSDVPAAEVAQVWESLGDVLKLAGLYDRASAAYTAARRLLGAPEPVAGVLLKHADVAERQGRYSSAMRWVRRGLQLVEGVGTREASVQEAKLAVWYATLRQRQGRHHEAIEWCRRAVEVATAAGERNALAQAYRVLDWAYVDLGRLDLATNSQAALAIYEELGDLSGQAEVLNNLGGFAYWQGRWADALEFYARSRDCKQRTGNLVDAALATANEAEILADQGRLDEAEAGFREALRVWQSVGYRRRVAFATMHLGRVASRRGEFDRALELLRGARSEFVSLDGTAEALETDVWITECLLLQRKGRESLQAAEDALRREAALGGAGAGTIRAALHRLRGYAFAQLGQMEEAWAALDESLNAARARGASYEVALTLEAFSVVAPLAGLPYRPSEAEHRLVLDRLGVKSLPSVPLPVPSSVV